MPTCTDHQLAADALLRAFLVNFIVNLESRELDYSSDSEGNNSDDSMDRSDSSSDSSSMSSSSESSDGDDSDFMSPVETDIFHNNSHNSQIPIEEQVIIALFRFGHYRNAASIMKVALQFGVGFGTVHLVTTRVLKVCCSEHFQSSSVQWANKTMKAEAKDWVEKQSCPALCNGWLMVDGTLVPLFCKPGYFGNVFFDRKSNYSLNVQVRNDESQLM
ncbi:hypothetical protein K443DRAFT_96467 [Laccaria amethystina LaAM-08-1]|uniref:DDE Tnp4 domain-containing protein n=1 Tax=Laccaria amethystina LaAM-08-1 TaxID=1095629 RepID=A0A0C9XYB1_9AGAR|nr:hypothetical protein K443DRAFT_96467 [Laccaria amethystina LaAM-08-1]